MSANDGLAYEAIVSDFASQGYKILFKGIANATKVGVPQTRRRLIILGARNGATEKLPDIEERVQDILNGANSLVSKYPICAMEALEGKTVPELADRYRKVMKQYEGVEDETKTDEAKRWKKNVWDNLTFNAVDDYLTANGIKKTDDAEVKAGVWGAQENSESSLDTTAGTSTEESLKTAATIFQTRQYP